MDKSKTNMRLLTAALALAAIAMACFGADHTPSGVQARIPADTVTTARVLGKIPTGGGAAAFHRRNRQDWAGKAHNQSMDLFRRALESGRYANTSMCDAYMDFVEHTDLAPAGAKPLSPQQRREAAALGLSLSGITDCPQKSTGNLRMVAFAAPRALARSNSSESAEDLLYDVEAAVDAATDANGLADALSPILDAADQLSDTDQTNAIYVAASVAQSSFEYWTDESNLDAEADAAAEQLYTSNKSCIDADPNNWSHCIPEPIAWRMPGRSLPLPFRASVVAYPGRCWLFSGKDIAKADVAGLVSGFLYGGWATAGLSIVGTAAAASTTGLLTNVVGDFACWLASKL